MTTGANQPDAMPRVGAHVLTAAGEEIGTVAELSGTAFKVDAPMQPDYWLPSAVVGQRENGNIRLAVEKDHVGDYKLDGPESAGGRPGDAIDLLVAMHVEAKQEFAAIFAAGAGAPAGERWRKLEPVLKLHEQMEETCLYRPLQAQRGIDTTLGEWEGHHQEEVAKVEAMIARADGLTPSSSGWMQEIKNIHDALAHHISEEQGKIFPRIREAWSQAQLDQAGAQMRTMKAERMGSMR